MLRQVAEMGMSQVPGPGLQPLLSVCMFSCVSDHLSSTDQTQDTFLYVLNLTHLKFFNMTINVAFQTFTLPRVVVLAPPPQYRGSIV